MYKFCVLMQSYEAQSICKFTRQDYQTLFEA